MLPVLASVLFDPDTPSDKRALLCGVYLPYFCIPLWLLYRMLNNPEPFPTTKDQEETSSLEPPGEGNWVWLK